MIHTQILQERGTTKSEILIKEGKHEEINSGDSDCKGKALCMSVTKKHPDININRQSCTHKDTEKCFHGFGTGSLARFSIEKILYLGNGMNGRVYEGICDKMGCRVALKTNCMNSMTDKEIGILDIIGKNQHPNMIEYFGSYKLQLEPKPKTCMVFEFGDADLNLNP